MVEQARQAPAIRPLGLDLLKQPGPGLFLSLQSGKQTGRLPFKDDFGLTSPGLNIQGVQNDMDETQGIPFKSKKSYFHPISLFEFSVSPKI